MLQHTIIHYLSFPHSIILKYHHFAAHKHILHLLLYFSCNTSLLRKQHNWCHNTKNNSNSSFYYIQPSYYLSHTSIYFTNTFLIDYPYLLPTCVFLIYLTNTISHKTYTFLTISIHLKRYPTLFQEHITKTFLVKDIWPSILRRFS